jgi:hypothetical protein
VKELVGEKEQADIEELVRRILRDLGNPEPPILLPHVRDLLSLDLKYYSSTDVGPIAEFAHRIRVAGKQIVANPRLLLDAVKKAKLSGLWLPDNRRILIDEEVPEPKHRWIEAHEITHSFVPWHAEFLLGDNESTLDPGCHAMIEAEANFGAGRLLFFGDRFAKEARDCKPEFSSIRSLQARYRNTLTTTFWRFVEDRDPSAACFGLISQHPHHRHIGAREDGHPVHHFVTSAGFRQKFPKTTRADVFAIVERQSSWRSKGPVIDAFDVLLDADGVPRKFKLDGFCNSYHLLTYGYLIP